MTDFEEALRNIDIFCKALVKKMVKGENEPSRNILFEPMEKLLFRKSVVSEKLETMPPNRNLVPLPHLEDPLIDVVEDEDHVKILMQERCKDRTVTVHTDTDGIEICRRECHTSPEGEEICVDKCQKLSLAVGHLKIEGMSARCSNNAVFEVEIPKKQS